MSALPRLDRTGNSRSRGLRPTGWLIVSLWSETLLREENFCSDIYCICRLLVSSADELKGCPLSQSESFLTALCWRRDKEYLGGHRYADKSSRLPEGCDN